ncbi:MAG: dUTP diphosphatase [Solirubrobacterales bacterium]
MQLRYTRLSADAITPSRAHAGDAGSDLYAADGVTLLPGHRARVGTGIAVAIPGGYAGLVLPRSGLAYKHGISLVNTPGLIDSGYRGELQVLLLNTDPEQSYEIRQGDRIAQLVVVPFAAVTWSEVATFEATHRATNGFGSSGS